MVIRFGPALKAAVLCLMIGGSGIGYVWQKEQSGRLGLEFKRRESLLILREKDNEKLQRQLAFLRSPQKLEDRIKELKLELGPPQASQIWRLTEPTGDTSESEAGEQYVNRNDPAVALHRGENFLPPPVLLSDEEPMATGGRRKSVKARRKIMVWQSVYN